MPGRGASNGTKNIYLPLARKHVPRGSDWGQTVGTDYWLTFNPVVDLFGTATAGTIVDELVDGGWNMTSAAKVAGTGADFMGGLWTPSGFAGTFGDAGVTTHAQLTTSGDLFASPAIFGDAWHAQMAAALVGRSQPPRFLIADVWAAMSVASTDENQSAFGFYEDDATVSVQVDQYAVIYSDGTNFKLAGNASTMSTGALVSTGWHMWRIVLQANGASGPNCRWYIDGVLQSTTDGVGALDEMPLKFGAHVITNDILVGGAHIYYDW